MKKVICILLSALMLAGIFTALPLSVSAAPAAEATGDPLSKFDFVRDYVEANYDSASDEGRYIYDYLTDRNGATKIIVFLTKHENNKLCFRAYYDVGDTSYVVEIDNFNFHTSYYITPNVAGVPSYGNYSCRFNSFNAQTYDPSANYGVTVNSNVTSLTTDQVTTASRTELKRGMSLFDAMLYNKVGLHLKDIGFADANYSFTVNATGIKLNTNVLTITAGNKYTLKATVTPADTTNKTVYWSSSDPTVAGMAGGGVLTAKKPGSCTITAKTHNGKTATCNVTVKGGTVPTSIKLNTTNVTMTAGTKYTLKATVSPSDATNKTVYYSSSNPSVAGMGNGGVINAKAPGGCVITAKTSNGVTATCKVTVKSAPASITLNYSALTVTAGKTATLKAIILPTDVLNKTVYFSSSDPTVAGMGNGGVVNAKKPGTCTVTAKTYNGLTATCKITVKSASSSNAPTGIKLSYTALTMTEGTKFTLKATVSPSNASNKTVYWSSSDPTIAGMQNGGVVNAKVPGTCTITAKTSNGKTATCKITVRSIDQRNLDNFGKLKTYIGTYGAPNEESNYVISTTKYGSGVQMYLMNTSDGGVQFLHIDNRSSMIYNTTLKWNLAVNKSATVTVREYTPYYSVQRSTSTSFNVGLYNGGNAGFATESGLGHECLNDALTELNFWVKDILGVSVQAIGFTNF